MSDFRWGTSPDDANNPYVLKTAMAEIERADLFVSLSASRYGWHGIDDELLQQNFANILRYPAYAWAASVRDRSQPELEYLAWQRVLQQSTAKVTTKR